MKTATIALTCIFGAALPCFADDADEIVFECKYEQPAFMAGYHAHLVADAAGISVTQYDNQNRYVRTITTNKPDGSSYYRKNKFEIAWGSTFLLNGKGYQTNSFIDRKTGIIKNAGSDGPTEIGKCSESTS
jgi:hypothetical protein